MISPEARQLRHGPVAPCLDQITSAINQIDRVTQANAASAEEGAAAAEELHSQARMMHDQVATLVRLVEGRGTHRLAGEPAPARPAGTGERYAPSARRPEPVAA